jgi:hypothetical protein
MSRVADLAARVIVGVDGSAASEDAAAFAGYLAGALGAPHGPTIVTVRVESPARDLHDLACRDAATLLVVGASHVGRAGSGARQHSRAARARRALPCGRRPGRMAPHVRHGAAHDRGRD